MKVLFDHQVFAVQRFGGVSRYFAELARHLRAEPDMQPCVFAPANINGYLGKGDPLHPLSFSLRAPKRGLRYRPRLLMPLLKGIVSCQRPQILHETTYDNCLNRLPVGVKRVTTLHDMIVELFPQLFDSAEARMARKRQALHRADAIVCISESTQRDLLRLYPELEPRCTVVHHGVAQQRATGPKPQVLPPAYLLYVGTRQTYKNFGRLVQALGAATGMPDDLKLVCFGGGAFSPAERELCERAGWSVGRILQIQGDDELLAQAYRHAQLFVFPSTYEGFGMPLTEAMVQGCPIACARASCFPEICGDSVAYFDAEDVSDIRSCLEALWGQPGRREALARAAEERGAFFTWARCAEQTAAVYRALGIDYAGAGAR